MQTDPDLKQETSCLAQGLPEGAQQIVGGNEQLVDGVAGLLQGAQNGQVGEIRAEVGGPGEGEQVRG